MTDTPYASEAGPPPEGWYSPQDFEVATEQLEKAKWSSDVGEYPYAPHVDAALAALARIKAHTEGLEGDNGKLTEQVRLAVVVAGYKDDRIAELEAGLRRIADLNNAKDWQDFPEGQGGPSHWWDEHQDIARSLLATTDSGESANKPEALKRAERLRDTGTTAESADTPSEEG